MKIALFSAEMVPFVKVGGLADVAGALPKALSELGHDVVAVIPRYGVVAPEDYRAQVIGEVNVGKGDAWVFKLMTSTLPGKRPVEVLMLDHPAFSARDGIYTDPKTGRGYGDDAVRYTAFSKAALEAVAKVGFKPDVIHLNDYHTSYVATAIANGVLPTGMKRRPGTILTIHNLAYQGYGDVESIAGIGIPKKLLSKGRQGDGVNLLRLGIANADAITTVSNRYAQEITTREFGNGLEVLLSRKKKRLFGVVNGIDYSVWNPRTDPHIRKNFTSKTLARKAENKEELLRTQGLSVSMNRPLIGMITRLADQKGLDLVAEAAGRLFSMDLSMIILGTGEKKYHRLLTRLAERYSKRIAVNLTFDESLAHRIEAGADMFLMPSRFEPCGLNQLYSLKYGTVPIVRAVGGLADTVEQFDELTLEGTGFLFSEYSSDALVLCVRSALDLYSKPSLWRKCILNGMGKDFSWENSAKEYLKIYGSVSGKSFRGALSTRRRPGI
jgi:starch synthase